jgi:acetyltransferase-like isoleucine patch superfamily enzyme
MKRCHVGHDAVIGADVEIAPGAVICGDVVIEDGVHVGVNASVKHGVTIGEGAVIGAGAVVIHDVPQARSTPVTQPRPSHSVPRATTSR